MILSQWFSKKIKSESKKKMNFRSKEKVSKKTFLFSWLFDFFQEILLMKNKKNLFQTFEKQRKYFHSNQNHFSILSRSKSTQTKDFYRNLTKFSLKPKFNSKRISKNFYPLKSMKNRSMNHQKSVESSLFNCSSRFSLKNSSKSIYQTKIYHFDRRNCLIECQHLSSDENIHRPENIFARTTSQLIKQSWNST